MTNRGLAIAGVVLILLTILTTTYINNKTGCERGIKGRESLIALRQGFEASAHGRYEKAKRQSVWQIALEERKEGDGLYTFARRITVHKPDCSGLYPVNK